MAAYAANRCEYYLQIEDDVTASHDFLSAVDAYIQQQTQLQVCEAGCGAVLAEKLFRNECVPEKGQNHARSVPDELEICNHSAEVGGTITHVRGEEGGSTTGMCVMSEAPEGARRKERHRSECN